MLGNSNMQQVINPNGVQYGTGTGLYWQLDASHLSFNTGVWAGNGVNVVIQNTYAPGNNNNAGGIILEGAPATGSACAGGSELLGAGTNGSTNGSSVIASGGCSNGFGATGSDVILTGGSTTANNSGGNVKLTPGTGGSSNGNVFISNITAGIMLAGANGIISPTIPASGTKCYPFQGTGGTGCDTPTGTTASFNAPQRVVMIGDITVGTTVVTLLTETVTVPSAVGTYRLLASYSIWTVNGANVCATQVLDTTNSFAWASFEENASGLGWSTMATTELSSRTYSPGNTPTINLQMICQTTGITAKQYNPASIAVFASNLPSYMSITPVLSNN